MRSRRRTLLVVAGVAAGSLAVGILAGTQIRSPADAASRIPPPEAGDITAPVELRLLKTQIVTRGDASFAGSVEVELELGGLSSPPVVTGQVPERGAEVAEGDVLLEIVGRPVLVLAGELPMYRSLQPGMTGPDVAQLEQILRKLGLNPGTVDDRYTADTGQAVARLFQRAGYPAPPADPAVTAELDNARDNVGAAEESVAGAERALRAAAAGPGEPERVAAQNEVDAARRALEQAQRGGDADAIAEAKAQLALAEAHQRELLRPPDTTVERAAVDAARAQLAAARVALTQAQALAGTPLPSAEIVFVPSLPRRVDDVRVRRGSLINGPVMSISGADLGVTVQVDAAARALLAEDMPASLSLPGGEDATGTITSIVAADSGQSGGFRVVITPVDLTPAQVDSLRSANVRVTIPVSSTEGEVLAVPLAALSAGAGNEARVEVYRDGTKQLLEVEVGLSAEGYAEVTPVNGTLSPGDLVVVGTATGDA